MRSAVTSGGAIPAGATVIDLGDATVLPGLIDLHSHLAYNFLPLWSAPRDEPYDNRYTWANPDTTYGRDVGRPADVPDPAAQVGLRGAEHDAVADAADLLDPRADRGAEHHEIKRGRDHRRDHALHQRATRAQHEKCRQIQHQPADDHRHDQPMAARPPG